MRKYIVFLLICLLPYCVYGQKISVADFSLLESDITANTEGSLVFDQNNDKCALIKIQTTEKGFTFDNGSLGIQKVEEKTAEIWVYVPQHTKKLVISHPELGSVTYDFPISIKKAKTYLMNLTTDKVFTATYDDSKSQRFILNINPKVAEVRVNGSVERVTNGRLEKAYSFGKYRYSVSADRYHTFEDTITINDPVNAQVRTVNLKQAFGWLKVDNADKLSDARLFVDNENKGLVSSSMIDLNSGTHVVRVVKDLYAPFESEIEIKDSVVTSISPVMSKDFGMVSLKVNDKDAEIWIDDEKKGVGSYEQNISSGFHKVECRKQYYTTTVKQIEVKNGSKESYTLDSPKPIYATLRINTCDVPAIVTIDDDEPAKPTYAYRNDEVLMGPHKVTVSQKGYKTVSFDVDLKANEEFSKRISLEAVVNVNFSSKPYAATLYLDDEYIGAVPQKIELKSGKHKVRMEAIGYYTYKGEVNFSTDEENFKKSLTKRYYNKNEFYVEGLGSALSFLGYGGAIGFNISNVNFEGFYMQGLEKSETIYFNYEGNGDDYGYGGSSSPQQYEFKVKQQIGGKIGFALPLHGRLRFIPQVGAVCTSIVAEDGDDTTYVMSGLADLKIQIALCSNVCLSLIPEYTMAVTKGKLYEQLEEVSTKIKGWGTGFNVCVGLNLFF